MRMARLNITMPDHVVARGRAVGVNFSALATAAVEAEVERQAKIAALDAYLAELEAELGPIPPEEIAEAQAWVARLPSVRRGNPR